MVGPLAQWRATGGQGFALLLGPTTSPSLAAQVAAMQHYWPQMRLYTHVPATRAALYQGTRMAFGRPLETHWRLAGARVVVCLDGDLLDAGPHQVGAAGEWIDARRAEAAQGRLLTMWAACSVPNLTRAKADYPLTAPPALIETIAQWFLARAAGLQGPALPQDAGHWCQSAWSALDAARGECLVQAGLHASPAVHEAAQRLNAALGNTGRTVLHTDPLLLQGGDLSALAADMAAGHVQALLMIGTNPVYDAPADLDFAAKLAGVKLKIHANLYADETALNADWHLPLTHPLEAWGDARSLDGTASLVQPTIAPLYDGRSAAEILTLFTGPEPRAGLDLLRDYWAGQGNAPTANVTTADARWQQALLSGVFEGGQAALQTVQAAAAGPAPAPPALSGGLSLVFRTDPTVWDGAVADNAWLQELPKPLSKIVWENVVGIGPGLAARLKLVPGDLVAVQAGGRTIEGPAWVSQGQGRRRGVCHTRLRAPCSGSALGRPGLRRLCAARVGRPVARGGR